MNRDIDVSHIMVMYIRQKEPELSWNDFFEKMYKDIDFRNVVLKYINL